MTRRSIAHVLALLVGAAMAAPAAEPGAAGPASPLRLSRRQAVSMAVSHNPAISAAREQVEQARARVVEASALPDPAFAATLEEQSSFLRLRSATAKDIGVALALPFPGKLRLAGNVARAALRSAQFALTQIEQQLSAQTAQAYDALLVTLRHRDDLTRARDLARDFLAKTEDRFRAGTAAKLDIIKARVDVAQAENDLIANQRATTVALAALDRLIGVGLGTAVEPTDDLDLPSALPELEVLERQAMLARPELQGLAADRQGARDATTLARRWWQPDLNLTLSRNFTAGDPPAYSTALSFGLPLFFGQHDKGYIAEARHREAELDAASQDLAAQVGLDVRTAYAATSTATRQAVYLRDELLPEAREAYRIVSVSYGLGGASALDLLDAKRTLVEAESQYAEALGAANDARADLERAVGAALPQEVGAHDAH